MLQFYHLTNRNKARKILKGGLKRGIDLGIQKYHYGIPEDNKWIYLSKKYPAGFSLETYPNDVLLEVQIPDEHPLERDKDIATFIEGSRKTKNILEIYELLNLLAKLRLKPTNGEWNFSKENIYQHIEKLSKVDWDSAFGLYRTSKDIPPKGGEYLIEAICPVFI